MKYSPRGRQLTERWEKCRLIAYKPLKTDVWTIGYGHTKGVYEGMTCTKEQADVWLCEDIDIAETNVNTHVTVKITQGMFDALVDFDINCGNKALDNSTLLKFVNSNDKEAAAKEFEKWDHSGGKIIAGLLRRRQDELNLFKE
jgi:lysozyme